MNAAAAAVAPLKWTPLAELSAACARGESPESYSQSAPACVLIEDPEARGGDEPLARWLAQLARPVVVRAPTSIFWEAAADCRIADRHEAQAIRATVEHAPLAALAFVQVLRTSENLEAELGLTIESLAYGLLQDGPEFKRWRSSVSHLPIANTAPPVLLDRAGASLHIQLNRPQARNALDVAMRDALVEAFELVAADASIERVLISGVGRCYSVGGDLAEFGLRPDGARAHQVRSLRNPARALLRCAARTEFELHGACIGSGIELPAFGARVVAKRDTYFQLPELRLGLIPGSGGCVSLTRRIGRQRTAWLGLSGRRINVERALAWGLIDAIID